MTEDQMSEGLDQATMLTGEKYDAVQEPACAESLVTHIDTDRGRELWKIYQYYERLPDWEADSGRPAETGPLEGALGVSGDIADPEWAMYNLSDADERDNLLASGREEPPETAQLRALLDKTRLDRRLVPRH
jgi:hypothetical protein